MTGAAWATQQLVEYVAALSACTDEAVLRELAVERATEAVQADAAALLCDGMVSASVGFRNGHAPTAALLAAADSGMLDMPGVGECVVLVAAVEGAGTDQLLLARNGLGFVTEEVSLARGMGRVLSLALRQLELVEELRSRQQLLEHLAVVQQALVRRAPLQEVLDAITNGARDLLGAEVVVFRLLDVDDPDCTVLVSAHGLSEEKLRYSRRRIPLSVGLVGQAITTDELVCVPDYEQPDRPARGPGEGLTAAMVAPLRETGRAVGALLITGTCPDRTFSRRDQDVLTAFADHVSLSLTDAHTMRAVREARHDPLTGLANRGLFYDQLDQILTDAPTDQPTSVLMIDLDQFKTVNDTLGHHAGDELLSTIAARLRHTVREGESTGRLGGDEFAVLLPNTDTTAAVTVAERVLDAVGTPIALAEQMLSVHASIGITTTTGGRTPQVGDLLRDADLAMYEAKRTPGNRWEVFAPALLDAALTRAAIRSDLEGALSGGQLWLAAQPIVELASGHAVGAEALLRWDHPQRGLITPAEFIPLAEDTGLISGIGRWVLHEACHHAASWPSSPTGHRYTIAVNVSARQLSDTQFIDDVADALTDSGLPARLLTLEITENLLIRDVEATVDQLSRLKALGIRLAVDDFGTGYSSLAYLAQFPIDILKIDPTFIRGLTRSRQSAALTVAIVRLGESLNLQVIAEGIEDNEHLDLVRALHCHLGQGYALGRPTPISHHPPRTTNHTPLNVNQTIPLNLD